MGSWIVISRVRKYGVWGLGLGAWGLGVGAWSLGLGV